MDNHKVYIFSLLDHAKAFEAIARYMGAYPVSRVGTAVICDSVVYADITERKVPTPPIPAALVTVEADEPGRCAECERQLEQVTLLANFAWDVAQTDVAGGRDAALSSLAEAARALLDQIDQENGND